MRKQGWAVTIDGFIPVVVELTGSGAPIDVLGVPGKLRGFYVNEDTAGTSWFLDDANQMFAIPAGLAAGTWVPLGDGEFHENLKISNDSGAGGSITVLCNPY